MSPPSFPSKPDADDEERSASGSSSQSDGNQEESCAGEIDDLIGSEGYAGPALSKKTVKPLTPEALAAFNTVQARSGVIYISRIPPGMQPAKVRHLLSQYGEVGRVYLQQEGGAVKPCTECSLTTLARCKDCILETEIHHDEKAPLCRGLGRIQEQACRQVHCGDAQCSANRRKERHTLARRCMDDEISSQVQVEHVD